MREYASFTDILDGEYKDTKRKAVTSSPRDAQFLDYLENDIARYESLQNLERATHLILDKVKSSYSIDAALRLRDLNAKRVVSNMVRNAPTFMELEGIKAATVDFPFAYDDIKESAYAAFDWEMERDCLSQIKMVSRDRDAIGRLRSAIGQYPFISAERHARVLDALTKAEKTMHVRLH